MSIASLSQPTASFDFAPAERLRQMVIAFDPKTADATSVRDLVDRLSEFGMLGTHELLLPSTIDNALAYQASKKYLVTLIKAVQYRLNVAAGAYEPGGRFYREPSKPRPVAKSSSGSKPKETTASKPAAKAEAVDDPTTPRSQATAAPAITLPEHWRNRATVVQALDAFKTKFGDRLPELSAHARSVISQEVPDEPSLAQLQVFHDVLKQAVVQLTKPAAKAPTSSRGSRPSTGRPQAKLNGSIHNRPNKASEGQSATAVRTGKVPSVSTVNARIAKLSERCSDSSVQELVQQGLGDDYDEISRPITDDSSPEYRAKVSGLLDAAYVFVPKTPKAKPAKAQAEADEDAGPKENAAERRRRLRAGSGHGRLHVMNDEQTAQSNAALAGKKVTIGDPNVQTKDVPKRGMAVAGKKKEGRKK